MLAEERARGQGLAPEALATFLEYVGRHLPYKLCSLVAKVSLDNEPSIRLFQGRLGFVQRSRCNVFRQASTTDGSRHFRPILETLCSPVTLIRQCGMLVFM